MSRNTRSDSGGSGLSVDRIQQLAKLRIGFGNVYVLAEQRGGHSRPDPGTIDGEEYESSGRQNERPDARVGHQLVNAIVRPVDCRIGDDAAKACRFMYLHALDYSVD